MIGGCCVDTLAYGGYSNDYPLRALVGDAWFSYNPVPSNSGSFELSSLKLVHWYSLTQRRLNSNPKEWCHSCPMQQYHKYHVNVPIFAVLGQSFPNLKERGARSTHVHPSPQLPNTYGNELRSLSCKRATLFELHQGINFRDASSKFPEFEGTGRTCTQHPNSQKHTTTSCAR